eukprot:CAMPEP_0173378546 /NCGR_PEP_ID=MMETSP1356-20130122/1687_1 /TAXON_ID=77927 ORGANISM="Hemiselmis virescens, Strain PCC157" /NCGR_SAMPLE_ID=MMETSP1356 /ASSEMBLY_ACC=CAM_ASM_000847 /LENGTH=108 /DNA_ID=CAMNT_0014331641 /DNA_START=20 /DNA_END=346 /DNA_ORIENTATION=-
MAALFGRTAAKALQMAKPSPALAKRAMGGGAPAAGETEFQQIWIKRDVYPIVFVTFVGCMYCSYTMLNYSVNHPEVQWSKQTKSKSVAGWYEAKYPGTTSSCAPGVRH